MALAFDVVDSAGSGFTAVVEFEETGGPVEWTATLWKDGRIVDRVNGTCASKDVMAHVAVIVIQSSFTGS